MDYLLCGNPPYPAWKKHISVQNLSNRRIRRYLVCRLKRPEARDFSHVRFTSKGTLKTLSVQSRDGQISFQADGSCYYVLAEKPEQDIPKEPTTQPTQTGADNSTDVNHAGSGAASGAKTGDDTPLELYIVLLLVGLITTSIAGLCRKKNYVAKQK